MDELNDFMPISPDHNRERMETLKQLFPDLFTNEGKLNPDEFKKLVSGELVSESERYDFRWHGKSTSKRTAFTPSRARWCMTRKVRSTRIKFISWTRKQNVLGCRDNPLSRCGCLNDFEKRLELRGSLTGRISAVITDNPEAKTNLDLGITSCFSV